MYVDRQVVALTTDASGNATGCTGQTQGCVLGIAIVVPGSGGIDNTADFTITAEATGEAILTITNQNGSANYYPRAQVCGPTGSGLTYDNTRTVNEPVAVGADRIKIVIAQGGNAKTCTVHVLLG